VKAILKLTIKRMRKYGLVPFLYRGKFLYPIGKDGFQSQNLENECTYSKKAISETLIKYFSEH
jgi:hypothetical protein